MTEPLHVTLNPPGGVSVKAWSRGGWTHPQLHRATFVTVLL